MAEDLAVFAHAPNWADPFLERFLWKTDVLEADDGSEQRIQVRPRPRIELEHGVLLAAREARAFNSLLYGCQARRLAVPFWHEEETLSAPLPAGSGSVPVVTVGRGYVAGAHALLWDSYRAYELLEVAAVQADQLLLAAPTTQAWDAGTALYPARPGWMQARAQVQDVTAAVRRLRLVFELEPADVPTLQAAFPAYRGHDVLDLFPDRAEDLTTEYRRLLDRLDFGTGVFTQTDRAGHSVPIKQYAWVLAGRDEILRFKSWLLRTGGQRVPSWFLEETRDLVLALDVPDTASLITVENAGYARYVQPGAHRQHLCLFLTDGSLFFREVLNAAEVDADRETLQLDAPFGRTVRQDEVAFIAFMLLGRSDADRIELRYTTDAAARVTLNIRGVTA